MELFNELMGSLGLNVVSFFNSAMPAQPMGWFKEEIKDVADERLEVPHCRSRGRRFDGKWECQLYSYQAVIQPAMEVWTYRCSRV